MYKKQNPGSWSYEDIISWLCLVVKPQKLRLEDTHRPSSSTNITAVNISEIAIPPLGRLSCVIFKKVKGVWESIEAYIFKTKCVLTKGICFSYESLLT